MARSLNGKLIGIARATEKEDERDALTSPNDDVLFKLKKLMPLQEYMDFFDEVYKKWRWSDYERYSQALRDKLTEVQNG